MAVMARDEQSAWTDERLDDLNHRVDEGFKETREEFRALRGEMGTEFRGVREEIATLQRTMLQLFAGTVTTMIIGFLGVIATVLTQT